MPRTKLEGDDRVAAQVEKANKPTEAFVEYADWLQEHAGVKISAKNAQLVNRLYGEFQAYNRENDGTRSKNGTGVVAPKPAAPRASGKTGRGVAPTDPGVDTSVEDKPAKPARRGAAAKPAASSKPASKPAAAPRSGRRGKVAAAEEAPY